MRSTNGFFVPSFAGCARAAEKRCLYISWVDMYLFLDLLWAVTWILCALFLPAHNYAWNSFRALSCVLKGICAESRIRGLLRRIRSAESKVLPGICLCGNRVPGGSLRKFRFWKPGSFRGYVPGRVFEHIPNAAPPRAPCRVSCLEKRIRFGDIIRERGALVRPCILEKAHPPELCLISRSAGVLGFHVWGYRKSGKRRRRHPGRSWRRMRKIPGRERMDEEGEQAARSTASILFRVTCVHCVPGALSRHFVLRTENKQTNPVPCTREAPGGTYGHVRMLFSQECFLCRPRGSREERAASSSFHSKTVNLERRKLSLHIGGK